MTGREFLRAVRASNYRLKAIEDRIVELKNNLYRVKTIDYETDRVDGGAPTDLADKITALQSLIDDASTQWDKLIADKRLAMAIIFEIEDERYQTILEERYINMRSWGYIARRLGYEMRQTFNLHGQALMVFDKLFNARNIA